MDGYGKRYIHTSTNLCIRYHIYVLQTIILQDKKPSEDCKANLALLKSAKLISFHLPSQGQQ